MCGRIPILSVVSTSCSGVSRAANSKGVAKLSKVPCHGGFARGQCRTGPLHTPGWALHQHLPGNPSLLALCQDTRSRAPGGGRCWQGGGEAAGSGSHSSCHPKLQGNLKSSSCHPPLRCCDPSTDPCMDLVPIHARGGQISLQLTEHRFHQRVWPFRPCPAPPPPALSRSCPMGAESHSPSRGLRCPRSSPTLHCKSELLFQTHLASFRRGDLLQVNTGRGGFFTSDISCFSRGYSLVGSSGVRRELVVS